MIHIKKRIIEQLRNFYEEVAADIAMVEGDIDDMRDAAMDVVGDRAADRLKPEWLRKLWLELPRKRTNEFLEEVITEYL